MRYTIKSLRNSSQFR